MKKIFDMAMFLWKRLEIINEIDFPGNTPGVTCWEEKRNLFKKYPNITKMVMEEYSKEKFNSSLPVLMVAREFLIESFRFFGKGEESGKITNFLQNKYRDCGASWTASGRGCCAGARAEALINQKGEIFAYKLSWWPATGSGVTKIFKASEVNCVTEALEKFNHFSGACKPSTTFGIMPSENWGKVLERLESLRYQQKVREGDNARASWKKGTEIFLKIEDSAYYKPTVSLNYQEGSCSKLQIKNPNVKPGKYRLYIQGYPVLLFLEEDWVRLEVSATTHWCNNQCWWFLHHTETDIQPGWIFVNGEDVFPTTLLDIDREKSGKHDFPKE